MTNTSERSLALTRGDYFHTTDNVSEGDVIQLQLNGRENLKVG